MSAVVDRATSRSQSSIVSIVTTSRLVMAVNRMNRAIMDALQQAPPPNGETHCVCHATEAEWTAFVDSEDHVIKPNYLEWFEDRQKIHIVEFNSTAHEVLVWRLGFSMLADPNISQWLVARGASTNSQG